MATVNNRHPSVTLPASNGCPAFEASLERVNVILGTNGSGKSKLLNNIAFHVRDTNPDFIVVQTEGGRQISLNQRVSGSASKKNPEPDAMASLQSNYVQALTGVTRKRVAGEREMGMSWLSPSVRFQHALRYIANAYAGADFNYRQRLYEWGDTDRSSDAPEREELDLLSELFDLFSEIFPEITISLQNMQRKEAGTRDKPVNQQMFSLQCSKRGNVYDINELSDGEKQVFASLVDRYLLRGTICFFVVDEPELNLDPLLACSFWDVMEREMPECTFLYATHSIDFAMRKNVSSVWLLGQTGPVRLARPGMESLTLSEQRQFLGSIRGIVTADLGVVVEGKDDSIDATFYQWLLTGNGEICVRSYGGCEDVMNATKRLDVWNQLAPGARLVGVVDRDYRSDEEVAHMTDTTCVLLDLHDAESYLCHPDVLIELADQLGIDQFPDRTELIERLKKCFENQKHSTSARRLACRCKSKRHVSLTKDQLSRIASDADLIRAVKKSAELDQKNPPVETSVDNVAKIIREELKRCKDTLDGNDILDMLRLFRGKELLDEFAQLLDLPDRHAVARFVARKLSPDDFPHMKLLRDSILGRAKS